MRKLLFALLAVALIAGAAYAASIPQSEDPQAGPGVWLVPVYSAGALDVGDVVVWAIDDSTGDNDNYVETTTTAETYLTAGVVFPNGIAAGGTGTIAIKGVVQVDVVSGEHGGITEGSALCTTTTAGSVKACTTAAVNSRLGLATQSASSGTVLVNVGE